MLLDMDNLFTGVKATGVTAQAITATANSTNIIDLGAQDGDVPDPNFLGDYPRLHAQVTEAFTNLTNLVVTLETDDNADFSSATEKLTSGEVLLADLVAGKRLFNQQLPEGLERYIRLVFTVTGSAPDAGEIVAGLTFDRPVNGL